ncbi:MAG: virulence protein RhuM/Fic/DOC family protein [Desulfuromonadales bacterium]|nr:virulence protein RhuM/Fic/DOC family protein [Desulfuromonadales bacterium]MDW7757495.1 virulence protein RhuM/Fic/DOC family protein [Desulfuromonadales bacterium]
MKPTETNVLIYQADDGKTRLDVQLDNETVWLTQDQMAELFDRDRSVITRHLRNVFREGELVESAVRAKYARTAADGKTYQTQVYNLDAIISVGYRVNSKRGTQFRQWATRVLRDHLVKGYTVHEQRLREESAKFKELRQTVDLLARTLTSQELVTDTGKEVLQVITDYAYGLALLDRYDHGQLTIEGTTRKTGHQLDYDEAIGIVTSMKGTFDGKELYPSVEEKAANLIYFVVKNHAFSDGNKRIAAALFVYFLALNQILYRPDGSKRLADNALVALTLLIAESRPEEKETIVKVIVNLINQSNE